MSINAFPLEIVNQEMEKNQCTADLFWMHHINWLGSTLQQHSSYKAVENGSLPVYIVAC